MDQGAWQAPVHRGRKESDMTEQLSMHAYTEYIFQISPCATLQKCSHRLLCPVVEICPT